MAVETPTPRGSDGSLRVGVAKVDITPADLTALNPIGGGDFDGVHDPLHLRALFASDGTTEVAIVATDLIEVGDMAPVRQRIEAQLGIPAEHVLITASHTHSAPRLGRVSPGALAHDGGPESAAYSSEVYDRLVGSLRDAREHAEPARVGYGAGSADVNVNRDVLIDGAWRLGFNADGPSDKAVRVIRFDRHDGSPIAVIANYAVHSVVTLGSGQISADIAGAAAREAERRLGSGAVALWTLGTVGDQNPRIQLGFPDPKTADEVAAAWAASAAQGLLVGAEVARVAESISELDARPRLRAMESVHPSPTKRGVDVMSTMRQVQVDTVDLRLIVILLGDIAICGVSGEVTTTLGERIRAASASASARTVVVSMANDRIGYLPDDDAFELGTFEANGSPIQAGHVGGPIVDGLSALVRATLA